MKKKHNILKLRVLGIAAITLAIILAACDSPWDGGDAASITINPGGSGGRSALPWDDKVDIDDLEYTITLTGGPGPDKRQEGIKSGQAAVFTVAPGSWDITARAYLGEALIAEGFDSVELKPGHNGAVSITMKKPGGYSKGEAEEEPLIEEESLPPPNGTSSKPYLIYTVQDLSHVGKPSAGDYDGWTLDKHYKQMANIDLDSVTNWTPIGELHYSDPDKDDLIGTPFTGSYDGDGHTISNLKIDTSADYQGLFGFIGTGAVVKNIGIVDCDIKGAEFVGGVVGRNGNNDTEHGGTVENCYATGNVSGTNFVGGVVGYNIGTRAKARNCYATGNVSGTGWCVGGVVGYNDGSVENCYATGNVTGTGDNVGGVVGTNVNGMAQYCYSTGNVSGAYNVGGVVGLSHQMSITDPLPTVRNCYSTGNVSGTGTYVGGVVGRNGMGDLQPGGTVENCYATGNVSGPGTYVSGVVGNSNGTARNCVALNTNISYSSTSSFYGRVLANDSTGTNTNNYGRSDMKRNNAAPSTPWTSDASGKDGENITSDDWEKPSWWTDTVLFDTAYWDCSGVNETKLPTLRNMPGAAQNPVVKPN